MKIKKDFITRTIAGETVVVPTGEAAVHLNGMITLNETGHFIWKCLEKETDKESIANEVTKEYDISISDAMNDIENFIAELDKYDILEK